MPIYEYTCTACNNELEVIQKINDAPLQQCPHCNQLTLKKRVSATSFRLKGSGWYETDFKGKKSNKSESVEKSDKNELAKPEPDKTEKTEKIEATPKVPVTSSNNKVTSESKQTP